MSFETIAALVFLILLTLFLVKNRKKFMIQRLIWPVIFKINIPVLYFALYRTKLGLKQMYAIAKKYPKIIDYLSKLGVLVGVLGIFLIAWILLKNVFNIFYVVENVSGVSLVLPFKIKGGFYVPFFYWIISIFVLATIHEFCHGVVARLHNTPIKSSGFAFMGLFVPIIPAAFVEPDEKNLAKKKRLQKMSVFSAGPFSNLVSGALFLVLFLLLSYPVAANVIDYNGVKIESYTQNSSAQLAGIPANSIITEINGMKIITTENLSVALNNEKVGDIVNISTNKGTYAAKLGKNPENASQPYLGVLVSQSQKTRASFEEKFGKGTASVILWFMGLLYWLYLLSVGIGLFNLVPVGPIDGGLLSKEIFGAIFKKERTALMVWNVVSWIFFIAIMINLLSGVF